jgi:hypothetical protein
MSDCDEMSADTMQKLEDWWNMVAEVMADVMQALVDLWNVMVEAVRQTLGVIVDIYVQLQRTQFYVSLRRYLPDWVARFVADWWPCEWLPKLCVCT